MRRRPRVVIIGAGFGGLAAAKGLAKAAVDVVVIDQHNFHTFQPLLYQVATAGLSGDDIAYPVRGILRRQRNARFRMGTVVGADLADRYVELDDGERIGFDALIVAAGAISNSFGVTGVDEYAFGMKSLEDADIIRNHVLRQFEHAAVEPARVADGCMNVVICGGGPTGVELAGGVAELYHKVLERDAPDMDIGAARIVLVEAAGRLLSTFSEKSSERTERTLARHGVEVVLGVGVAEVTPGGVVLADGRDIPAETVIWAAGVQAHPLARVLGVPLNARGRIVVDDDLSVPEHPMVFAVGDIASDLPQVAQPAIQGGRHAAEQVTRRLRGRPTTPFGYVDKGSMATIGRNDAVTELPSGRQLDGFVGWVAWLGLHLVALVGFRNRLRVLVNWFWNYLTYDRSARLLTAPDPADEEPTTSAPH